MEVVNRLSCLNGKLSNFEVMVRNQPQSVNRLCE